MLIITSLFSFIITNTDSSKVNSKLLDEVQITANRIETSQFNASFSIESKSSKSLHYSNLRTTPEALMGLTGVFVQKTNHGGGSAFIRGLTGNQALILVDGIRLNNSTFRYGPNQYLNTIDPYSLQKIEVLKGSGSVQYGSDALGGVIHTITETPTLATGFKTKILAKYTPAMEKTIRPSISLGLKNIAFSAAANFRNFGDLVAGKGIGKQSPTGYDEASFNLKTYIQLKNGSLTAAHQNLAASDVPVYHKIILENFKINEFGDQKRNLTYLKIDQKTKQKSFENIELIASLQNTYETRISQKNNANSQTLETDQVQVLGLVASFTSKFSARHLAQSGLEVYTDLVKSKKKSINTSTLLEGATQRGLYPDRSQYDNISAFSLHQYHINQWQISTGLRYNIFKISIPSQTLGTSVLNPQALVGNLALMRTFNETTNVYLSFNSGFRAPNIDDMGTLGLVDFRYELPNYDLKPEKSQNWELGLKHQSDKLSLNTAIFYNQLENLITRVKVAGEFKEGNQVYVKENTDKAYIKGAEISTKVQFTPLFAASAGMSYLFGENISKKEPMRRIPPLNGHVSATYRKGNFFFQPEYLFAAAQKRLAQGDIDDNRIGPNGTAAWQVFNIYSGYDFNWLKLNLLAHNIGNKAFKTHGSGVYGMGRAISISMEFSF